MRRWNSCCRLLHLEKSNRYSKTQRHLRYPRPSLPILNYRFESDNEESEERICHRRKSRPLILLTKEQTFAIDIAIAVASVIALWVAPTTALSNVTWDTIGMSIMRQKLTVLFLEGCEIRRARKMRTSLRRHQYKSQLKPASFRQQASKRNKENIPLKLSLEQENLRISVWGQADPFQW